MSQSAPAALNTCDPTDGQQEPGLSPSSNRPSSETSAPYQEWCIRFGMTPEAVDGWSKLCRKPCSMLCTFYLSVLCWQTVLAIMLAGKRPITAWHVITPHVVVVAIWVVKLVRMWRMGPQSAFTPLNGMLALPHLVCMMFIGLAICVGPLSWIPYRSRPLSVVLLTFLVFFVNCTGNCGAVHTLHPPEPHPSIKKPVLLALLDTGRVMDTLTDGFTIRMLLQQADGECFWFGTPGYCARFVNLATFIAVMLTLKFFKGFFFFLMRAKISREDPRGFRLIIGGHVATLLCDLGIAAVTLVNIFSFASNPPTVSASFTERSKFQGALRTALLSCAFTVMLFIVNMIGFRNVFRRVESAVRRVSVSAQQIRKSRAYSSNATVPLREGSAAGGLEGALAAVQEEFDREHGRLRTSADAEMPSHGSSTRGDSGTALAAHLGV